MALPLRDRERDAGGRPGERADGMPRPADTPIDGHAPLRPAIARAAPVGTSQPVGDSSARLRIGTVAGASRPDLFHDPEYPGREYLRLESGAHRKRRGGGSARSVQPLAPPRARAAVTPAVGS